MGRIRDISNITSDVISYDIQSSSSSSSSCRATSIDFLDSFFPTRLYHPSFPAGFSNYILCTCKVVGKFLLVCQHWHVHMQVSVGKRHLWIRSFVSSSVPNVLFVLLDGSRDGSEVAVELLLCGVLLPGLVKYSP